MGAVVVAALVLWSCEQNATETGSEFPELTPATVGEMHNEGLDFVLARLQKHSKAGNLTPESALEIARSTLHEFSADAKLGGVTDAQWHSSREIVTSFTASPGTFIAASSSAENANGFSPEANLYLTRIQEIIETPRSLHDLEEQVAALERSAKVDLTGEELDAFVAIASTTVASAKYWDENYDAWLALCDDNPELCQSATGAGDALPAGVAMDMSFGKRGWIVLGSDVVGAIGGALRGGWFGAAVGGLVASTIAVIATS